VFERRKIMKKAIRIHIPIYTPCILGIAIFFITGVLSLPALLPDEALETSPSVELLFPTPERNLTDSPGKCTAFCLDNGDHCVFGANMDNTLEIGHLFINKRQVLKNTWDPSTSGEHARWTSRYGSVTINFVGYQMAWAGMNEAGLMISTMGLPETRGSTPDERPPFEAPFWMQYQLDNHSTVDQVIASDAEIRLAESAVDHYLVCDRVGACATIEFIEGKMIYHTSNSLPVKVLTNNTYADSVRAWEENLLGKSPPEDNSLWRFITAANRVDAFEPSSSDEAITYAFDTLAAVSRRDTVWSFVFDPANLRVYFRTNHNPSIRYLDLSTLDFSCSTPVRLLDIHADVSGNISDELVAYTHVASFAHSTNFFSQYEGVSMSPFIVDTLLWGLESFSCQDGDISTQADLVHDHPLLPPTVGWVGLTILHRVGPTWILLTMLSLAFIIWRMFVDQPMSLGQRFVWVLLTILLGPCALIIYLLFQKKKRRVAEAA
jgi:penicillin V acylase-like amidase (Ntn superfamily)